MKAKPKSNSGQDYLGLKIELLFCMHQIHSDSQQKSIGKGPYMSKIFNIYLNKNMYHTKDIKKAHNNQRTVIEAVTSSFLSTEEWV